jgi:DNA mismatch repair protein MutL
MKAAMPVIRILSEQLVNQIAAGEVIERPASVVKELIENAVDAQASRLLLELEEAGKKLIRVSDDGLGMAPADVPLALASHATSKLASADDLDAISTLGFRGEALASIASVADVRVVSRTADLLEATEVTVSGGKASEPHPTSGPVGTTIEVRNLFRYVPARRKFLKTDPTEMGHITEQVMRVALAYPAVHFTVTHNGRSVYELPATDQVRDRVAVFFGEDLARSLLEVGSDEPAGRLWGLVGPPQVARATAGAQYLFINGRYVRDRSLLHALREAYRGMIDGNRQAVAFLFLTVPPDRVDVNVHPTKIEVRLREAHLLYGQVLAGVRGRLLGPGISPHVEFGGSGGQTARGARRGEEMAPAGDNPGLTPGARTDEEALRQARVREAVADFLRSPQAAQPRLPLSPHAEVSRAPGVNPGLSPHAHTSYTQDFRAPGAAQDTPRAPGVSPGLSPRANDSPPTEDACGPAPTAQTAGAAFPPQARAIQLHNTYLVAETPDGIVIVDQHALHERILFEDMMARLEAGPLEAQRLLLPATVNLTDREMAAVETHRDALARLGIDAEPMGPRTVAIHAFPSLLARAEPEGTLRDFLAWALALDSPPAPRQVLEHLAHVAACRAAVKAGDTLKPDEIEALLARRASADVAATCPHGRPTALVLSKSDLERQFGRNYASAPARDDEPLPF